jgi:hypothetical protein
MKAKLNKKQKAFVDELFRNGFNQTKAYMKIYEINNKDYATNAGSRLMANDSVKQYYNHKYEEYRESLNIDKQKMIDMLMDEINLFAEMKYLASKEEDLTYEEEMRLSRLSNLLKGSDINKARDMINKMIGAYEPEKQEITHKGITINILKPNNNE